MQSLPGSETRWQLYRLLSDPVRLKLLALAAEEELSVGELAELLGEAQPNVSRHAAPLRQAGLLSDRRQGTRTLMRLSDEAERDPVVGDALGAGRRLCEAEGSLAKVAEVVASRDQKTREFFAQPVVSEVQVSAELPVYLSAFAGLIEQRGLAVDAGTGDGVLLDLLAPVYDRVVGIDRSTAQLERARQRVRAHGYQNVTLIEDQIGGEKVRAAVGRGADLVLAVRVLHHAPRPKAALRDLGELARPGGKILVIDYARHDDERMSEQQADVWLGFSEEELRAFADAAGLEHARVNRVPASFARVGVDAHLPCLTLLCSRPKTPATAGTRPPPQPIPERKKQEKS